MPQPAITSLSAVYQAERLPLSDAELERYGARYPAARAAADLMFELPEAKYIDPVTVFTA